MADQTVKFDQTVVTGNTLNPLLVDGRDDERTGTPKLFRVTNAMMGVKARLLSDASNINQLLEDYNKLKQVEESTWGWDWDDMAISINTQNYQDYHRIPRGGIVTLTEGKNTSGLK